MQEATSGTRPRTVCPVASMVTSLEGQPQDECAKSYPLSVGTLKGSDRKEIRRASRSPGRLCRSPMHPSEWASQETYVLRGTPYSEMEIRWRASICAEKKATGMTRGFSCSRRLPCVAWDADQLPGAAPWVLGGAVRSEMEEQFFASVCAEQQKEDTKQRSARSLSPTRSAAFDYFTREESLKCTGFPVMGESRFSIERSWKASICTEKQRTMTKFVF